MKRTNSSPEDAARHLAAFLRANPSARIALSGGSSPRQMLRALCGEPLEWFGIHLYQVDERAVPFDDPQNNGRMILESLPIPGMHFHRINTTLPPHTAAREYAQQLPEQFDLIHCGIGPDSHTASLFPGDPLIHNRQDLAAATWVEKMHQWRITLLPRVLLSARELLIFAPDKGEVAERIFNAPFDPLAQPAQILTTHPNAHWFL